MAHAAVVAGSAALVHLREDGGAADGHHAAIVEVLRDGFFHHAFGAVHFHGGKEFAVRKLRKSFGLAADASVLFDIVVPRLDIFVANGPIDGDAFLEVGFKVQIAPAIALAAPDDGLATDLAAANPGERFVGIGGEGIFQVVDEKLVGVFVAGVITLALDFLCAFALGALIPAAEFEFPGGDVFDVVDFRDDGAAGFEDQDL